MHNQLLLPIINGKGHPQKKKINGKGQKWIMNHETYTLKSTKTTLLLFSQHISHFYFTSSQK